MSVFWRLVSVCTFALCSASAHADLVRGTDCTPATSAGIAATPEDTPLTQTLPGVAASGILNSTIQKSTEADWLQNPVGTTFAPVAAQRPDPTAADSDRPSQCLEIPPVPSSYTLGLSTLASLGLVQAGRSLRRLQIGFIPDWYHAGGPMQIGHTKVFDLEHSWSLAIRPHTVAVRVMRPAYPTSRCELDFAAHELRSSEVLIPRGPPFRG